MGRSILYITFPVGNLTIGVCGTDAHLLTGRLQDSVKDSSEPNHAARSAMHNGRVIPCLNLRSSLGVDPAADGEDTCTLILHDQDELACVHVPEVWFKPDDPNSTAREVASSFKGLARLLLAEERDSEDGVWYLLDVEMVVRIARQASDVKSSTQPVTWR
jgi:hypothetical protein